MWRTLDSSEKQFAMTAGIAIALYGAWFILQARLGLDLADEGFLWYGAVATAKGQIPLRDFYSYDPGRYVWCWPWIKAFGEGIVVLRVAGAAFGVLGLLASLAVARRCTTNRPASLLLAVATTLWMIPRHKLFDCAWASLCIWVLVRLLEAPATRRRYLQSGVFLGLAAFLGKNHALYTGVALLGGLAYVRWVRGRAFEPASLWALTQGTALGLLPLVAMLALVPRFGTAYLDSITFFLAQGRTNTPLPVPWPWLRVPGTAVDLATHVATGSAFVLLPLAYAGALAIAIIRERAAPRSLALLSSALVGVPYLHHAFSRADVAHLGQSIHPFLLTMFALTFSADGPWRRWVAWGSASLVALLSLAVATPFSPIAHVLQEQGTARAWSPLEVRGNDLVVPADVAALVGESREVLRGRAADGDAVLVLPYYPALYVILDHASPAWNTFLVWPDKDGADARMLRESATNRVEWVILGGKTAAAWPADIPGHPVLSEGLRARFEPVIPAARVRAAQVLRRKDAGSPLAAGSPARGTTED